MKWIGNRQSDNIEDKRGMSAGGKVVFGGGIALVFFLLKTFLPDSAPLIDNIQSVVQQQTAQGNETAQNQELTAEQKEIGDFSKTVFAYTEDTWTQIFQENNLQYEYPKWFCFQIK